jgi:hypothetical protein
MTSARRRHRRDQLQAGPTCEEFIRDYLPGELFYNFIVGPYGSGKTSANLMKLVVHGELAGAQPRSTASGARAR